MLAWKCNRGLKSHAKGLELIFVRTEVTSACNWRGNWSKRAKWQSFSPRWNCEYAYCHWGLGLTAIWNLMWSTSSVVLDSIHPMVARLVEKYQENIWTSKSWFTGESTSCAIVYVTENLLIMRKPTNLKIAKNLWP